MMHKERLGMKERDTIGEKREEKKRKGRGGEKEED